MASLPPQGNHPFDRLVAGGGEGFRLAEAALLFPVGLDDPVDVGGALERINVLADRANRDAPTSGREQAEALRRVLCVEEGLEGNRAEYHDPRNSFLHRVLERRRGIPISLSVLWLDIANRLGWPFHGVGLPGHFLVCRPTRSADWYFDPFHGGRAMDRGGTERLVREVLGPAVFLTDEHYAAMAPRAIVFRMLNNLRMIYLGNEQWPEAAHVLLRMRALAPEERGLDASLALVAEKLAELN